MLDGVLNLVQSLEKQRCLIGLVTGNLEPIARGKMQTAGLNHFFRVGGFGSDDINRANLVRLAIKRVEEYFGFLFDKNVVLFGDAHRI